MSQQDKYTLMPKAVESSSYLRRIGLVRKPMTIESFRQSMAAIIIALYMVWVILGLIVFMVNGNPWLLASAPVLAYPLHRVIDYYFRGPTK